MEKSLREIAVELCKNGENCSRSILVAGGIKYNLELPQKTIDCCNGISAGFGFGGICSALVAGVMLLGILYDDNEAKQKSLVLFCAIQGEFGGLECCNIGGVDNCYELIGMIAECLEEIIDID